MELSDVGTRQTFMFDSLTSDRYEKEVDIIMGVKAPSSGQMFLFGPNIDEAKGTAIKAFMEQHHD